MKSTPKLTGIKPENNESFQSMALVSINEINESNLNDQVSHIFICSKCMLMATKFIKVIEQKIRSNGYLVSFKNTLGFQIQIYFLCTNMTGESWEILLYFLLLFKMSTPTPRDAFVYWILRTFWLLQSKQSFMTKTINYLDSIEARNCTTLRS